MPKSVIEAERVKLTVKKAHTYLSSKGLELSTQQVRNLMRTNEIVSDGKSTYIDPVTDEETVIIYQDALDKYLAWREKNPDASRAGRKADPNAPKKYTIMLTAAQFDTVTATLNMNDLPVPFIPEKKLRGPRKPRNTSVAPESTNGVEAIGSDMAIDDLELIEIGE